MRRLSGSRPRLRLSRSGRRRWLRRRSRQRFRRFDTRGRRLGRRGRDRLRRRRRRLKLDWSRRRRGLLLHGRRGLLGDRRRRCFRRGKRRLLHGRRRSLGRRRRGLFCRRRLRGNWRGDGGWRRRRARSRGGVLSWRRRGLFGRLRLIGRRHRILRRRFRLNVDDHFSRRLKLPRLQGDEEERGGVKRDHDQDDEWAEPWRTDGRRLEDTPVQSRDRHGAGALGLAGAGVFGADEAGGTTERGPDTMAIREIPAAASSSITETTSP